MACNSRNNNTTPAFCCTSNGTCEKTCIEVKKVFDACMLQQSMNTTLEVDFDGDPTGYSVVSLTSSGDATVTDLVITPIPGTATSRVSHTLSVPITVVAANSAGSQLTGSATMTIDRDIVMRVPSDGLIAPTVEATVMVDGLQNTLAGTSVTTNACVTIITKVVADVILVIPSYGYPIIPPCQEYTQDVCSSVFNTPVYPR